MYIGSLFKVNYSKKLRKITLLRCIVTKAKVQPDKVSFKDVVALYDTMLWAQLKSSQDHSFRQKFGDSLEELALKLKSIRFGSEKSQAELIGKVVRVLKHGLDGFSIPARNFAAVYGHVRGDYTLQRVESEGVPNSKLPPKQFIGKGYGDKGTAQKPWLDGNPSWQEVAANHQFQRQILLKEVIREVKAAQSVAGILGVLDKYLGKPDEH